MKWRMENCTCRKRNSDRYKYTLKRQQWRDVACIIRCWIVKQHTKNKEDSKIQAVAKCLRSETVIPVEKKQQQRNMRRDWKKHWWNKCVLLQINFWTQHILYCIIWVIVRSVGCYCFLKVSVKTTNPCELFVHKMRACILYAGAANRIHIPWA